MNNLNTYEDFATDIANMITFTTLEQKKKIRDAILIRLASAHLHKDTKNDAEIINYVNYYKTKSRYE